MSGCPRYDYSELFWFGTIEGGPKTVRGEFTVPFFYPYANVQNGLDMLLGEKYFSGENGAGRFFQSIRKISILILIDGSIWNHGNKVGICNLRYTKAKHDLSFDLHITEEQWADSSLLEFQKIYAELMRQGLRKCLERAKKIKGEVLDEMGFVKCYEAAIEEFLGTTYPYKPRILTPSEIEIALWCHKKRADQSPDTSSTEDKTKKK